MRLQPKILTLMLLLASPACTWACFDPAGSGQCGPNGIGPRNPGFGYNTYVEPEPVYTPPPQPSLHCTTRADGGKTCIDISSRHEGNSFSTNAAGEFDGAMVSSYSDGTPQTVINFRNGEAEGKSSFFYPDGGIQSIMYYQNDELNGTVQHYHPNGTLRVAEVVAFALAQPDDTNISEFTIGPTTQPW